MTVQKKYISRFLKLLCICFTISACSNGHDQSVAKYINSEFEQTYLYVSNNMSVDIDFSNDLSNFRKSNKDAFTSIAYTWHSISIDACGLASSSNKKESNSSYERLIQQSPIDKDLSIKMTDSERICLANIYFDNWSNINNMLKLSFSRSR
ncbi:MAG: hypothetical protein R8G33_02335 [Gammaproteobacteria bacterium]|nr:hypothetical protein [Gammaproteobacteria bacterium]